MVNLLSVKNIEYELISFLKNYKVTYNSNDERILCQTGIRQVF